MRQEIVIAGFGGQGIMFAGKILAYAAMREGKNITYFPSYGAEVRGGTANATTIISTEEIPTPVSPHPDVLLAMNSPSCMKFEPRIKKKGLLIANITLIDNVFSRRDITIVKIPATSLAHKLGNKRVANMIMLGVYLRYGGVIALKSVEKSIPALLRDRKELWDINREALRLGNRYV